MKYNFYKLKLTGLFLFPFFRNARRKLSQVGSEEKRQRISLYMFDIEINALNFYVQKFASCCTESRL